MEITRELNKKSLIYSYSIYTFFLIQQFITQGTRADYGSYIVTTYKTSKLYGKKTEKEKN